MTKEIVLIPGDGIGPEITNATKEVGHSRNFMINMIKNSEYIPVERDALYNEVKVYS